MDEDGTTKPTIETVLQRINSLGEHLQSQISELKDDFGLQRVDLGALRNEFQLFRGRWRYASIASKE